MRLHLALAALCTLAACDGGTTQLYVDLRTDLVPGEELDSVRTVVESIGGAPMDRAVEAPARRDGDFLRGVRVAAFEDLGRGTARVRVELARGGVTILQRPVLVELTGAHTVSVVVTRSCLSIECGADACVAGRCVDPSCTAPGESGCGAPCDTDEACGAAAVACAEARCVEGACLLVARAGACADDEWCDPDSGCRPRGGGEPDAGVVDAGSDAGPACAAGETSCAGSCVDLATSEAHCGACGASCSDAAQTCWSSSCGFEELLHWINLARSTPRDCGGTPTPAAPALTWEPRIEAASLRHARDMAATETLSFDGSDGSTPSRRLSDAGYSFRWMYPQIFERANAEPIGDVVDQLLADPTICGYLMEPRAVHLGGAAAAGPTTVFAAFYLAQP